VTVLHTSPVQTFGLVAYTAVLAACAVCDLAARRIPNVLVFPLAALGITVGGLTRGVAGAGWATACLALGLAIWLPFYLVRAMGAGDVKLFAAAAAWLTPGAVLDAALLSALVGGILGVVWFVRTHGARFAAVRLAHAAHQPRILREPLPAASPAARVPYGVAMVASLLFTAWRLHSTA
jgi:prepilin peptidase CpaA